MGESTPREFFDCVQRCRMISGCSFPTGSFMRIAAEQADHMLPHSLTFGFKVRGQVAIFSPRHIPNLLTFGVEAVPVCHRLF
jgi:hypothetical protein